MDKVLTAHLGKQCSSCVLAQFCLPAGIAVKDMPSVDTMVTNRIHLKKRGVFISARGEL